MTRIYLQMLVLVSLLGFSACGKPNPHIELVTEKTQLLEDITATLTTISDQAGAEEHAADLKFQTDVLRELMKQITELGSVPADSLDEIANKIGTRATTAAIGFSKQTERLRGLEGAWGVLGG